MQVNISKSPFQNLLDLVNSTNGLSIATNQVAFSAPTVTAAETFDPNTSVTVTPGVSAGYSGTVEVTYARLRLDKNVATPQTTFITNGATTLESLKTDIATALNLLESEFSISGTLPVVQNTTSQITVTSVLTSLLFVGAITVTADWPIVLIDLATAVAVTNLNGFDPVV